MLQVPQLVVEVPTVVSQSFFQQHFVEQHVDIPVLGPPGVLDGGGLHGFPAGQGTTAPAWHGLQRECTVTMCARLKGGGPVIPWEWFCQVCGCEKGDQVFKGAPPKGPQRERQAVGRSPPQGSSRYPTERRPSPPQGSRKPVHGKLSQQVILDAFKNLGVILELMQHLRDTLDQEKNKRASSCAMPV